MEIYSKLGMTYKSICDNKFYFIAYFLLILIIFFTSVSFLNLNGHYKFVYLNVFISVILGFLCLVYYFNHENELHKVAFVIILCFGVICALITPIFIAPDEVEHFARSLLTSQGSFFPQYIKVPENFTDLNNFGWCIDSTLGFRDLYSSSSRTFFDSNAINIPINNSHSYFIIAALHNPFYGYLAQGFGILLANLLNLNLIWTLWLGRIFNILLYAVLVSVAIKKTPILKVPMLFMALLPLAIYQGASMSIDATVNGLGFIVVAYFFYLFKSNENSITIKEISIFSILVLLLSLTKLTYLSFMLLLLCVPRSKFKQSYYYNLIFAGVIFIIAIIWSSHVTPIYDFSRMEYYINNNVNSTLQINYLINHPTDAVLSVLNIFSYIGEMLYSTFTFYYNTELYSSTPLMVIGILSFIIITFVYPIKEKISLKSRFFVLFILIINYIGTYMIQLLKWTPVGQVYNILGVQPRYFIPLFPLLPFIFTYDYSKIDRQIMDKVIVLVSICLSVSLIFTILYKFY